MWSHRLYVLDCENEPDSRGRYRLHCIDNDFFEFHTLTDVTYRKSPGDSIDITQLDLSALPFSKDIPTKNCEANLPLVIRKLIIDHESYYINCFCNGIFASFPNISDEIKDASLNNSDCIYDYRDLSTILQKDVVTALTECYLEQFNIPNYDAGLNIFWNPDGSSDFEFAEKLNGMDRLEQAAEYYQKSRDKGYPKAETFLSTDFLKVRKDGILSEDDYRHCRIIHILNESDPDVCYKLACHHEENLRHNKSYKGATATRIVELYKVAQSKGNLKASYRLGNIHQYGLGRMSSNLSKATKAYRKCGDHPDALFRLASCYESSYDYITRRGVDGVTAEEICTIYRRSADLGNDYARNRITLLGPSDPMAFTESRLLAHAGDQYAMYILAQCYESGSAGSVSYERAIQLYREIIDSAPEDRSLFQSTISFIDDVPALYPHDLMYRIGELYELSNLRDYRLALEWFTRSADAGNRKAKELIDISDIDSIPEEERLRRLLLHSEDGDNDVILNIARCYEFGIGTKKDPQKSKEYRDILAAKDDPDSQYWVATYLENRARTKADFDDAHAWYVRAMNNGSEKAKNRLDTSDIKDVPENKLFAKCRLFSHSDDPDIQYALGRCYELGLGVSVSYSLARSHYQRASDLGSTDAEEKLDKSRIKECTGYERYRRLMMFSDDRDPIVHHEIGTMYLEGTVVERSPSLAFGWFESAAGMGHLESATKCADMMYTKLVKQDKERMLAYYRMSADKGDVRSNRIIGKMLTEPGSKEKGHPEAVRRLRSAAHRNDPESQYLLGRMFEKGLGMPQFYAEAFRWYSLAADQGHFESRYRMMLFLFAGRGTRKNESKANAILDDLRRNESNRLLRFVDSCVRGKDPLSIEFKAEHLS